MREFLRGKSNPFRSFVLARAVMAVILACLFIFYPVLARQGVSDIHGSADELLAHGRGKILVLVFVRTDCPISNRYAPLLQEMSKKYRQQASFRLVFPDRTESPDKIRYYLQEYGYELSAIRDPDHALVKKTMAKATPEAAVFDGK